MCTVKTWYRVGRHSKAILVKNGDAEYDLKKAYRGAKEYHLQGLFAISR
jgi:hypothetical protein